MKIFLYPATIVRMLCQQSVANIMQQWPTLLESKDETLSLDDEIDELERERERREYFKRNLLDGGSCMLIVYSIS